MKWLVQHGNILDQPADVLICSANPFLNLSGGVGGEILLRHGDAMQKDLHRHLAERKINFVERGEVITTRPHGLPHKAVLHAVAVDGFYQSSPLVIREIVGKSLRMAAALGAKSVGLTVLATGYGQLTMKDFAQGVAPLMTAEFPPVASVVVCVRKAQEKEELEDALASSEP